MSRGNNYSAQTDPAKNPQFKRRWSEDSSHDGGLRPVGEIAAELVANIRFRRQVEHLHQLGPRAVGELLAEVAADRGIRVQIEQRLNRYADLSPEALEATGGGDFWPVPFHEVR